MFGFARLRFSLWSRTRCLAVSLGLGCTVFGGLPCFAQDQVISFTAVGTNLYSVRIATGELTLIGDTGFEIAAMALSPQHGLVAVETGDRLVALDQSTGQASVLGPLGVDVTIRDTDLGFDDPGQLWMLANRLLYRIDTMTGAATAALGSEIPGIGLAWQGSQLYTADDRLHLVDPATGDAQSIGPGSPISYSVNLSPYRANTMLSLTAVLAGPNVFYQVEALDLSTGERQYLFVLPDAVGFAVQPLQAAAVPGVAGYGLILLVMAMAAAAVYSLRDFQ